MKHGDRIELAEHLYPYDKSKEYVFAISETSELLVLGAKDICGLFMFNGTANGGTAIKPFGQQMLELLQCDGINGIQYLGEL